jgi:hypothetical protein
MQRWDRVATRRHSLSCPKMISMRLRRLVLSGGCRQSAKWRCCFAECRLGAKGPGRDTEMGDYDENPTILFKAGQLPPPVPAARILTNAIPALQVWRAFAGIWSCRPTRVQTDFPCTSLITGRASTPERDPPRVPRRHGRLNARRSGMGPRTETGLRSPGSSKVR